MLQANKNIIFAAFRGRAHKNKFDKRRKRTFLLIFKLKKL